MVQCKRNVYELPSWFVPKTNGTNPKAVNKEKEKVESMDEKQKAIRVGTTLQDKNLMSPWYLAKAGVR
jgi:hypothetical protein